MPSQAAVLGFDQGRLEEVRAQLAAQFAAEKDLYRAAERA